MKNELIACRGTQVHVVLRLCMTVLCMRTRVSKNEVGLGFEPRGSSDEQEIESHHGADQSKPTKITWIHVAANVMMMTSTYDNNSYIPIHNHFGPRCSSGSVSFLRVAMKVSNHIDRVANGAAPPRNIAFSYLLVEV